MANFMLGYTNFITAGVIAAGASNPGLPVANLQNTNGSASMGWQSLSTSAWFTMDSGSAASQWQAFGLFRTNLSLAATVRWRIGPANAIIEETPLVDLNYQLGSIATPAGYNFSRASSGMAFDAAGVLQTVASNALRLDYDPTTHLCAAVKEEARTNGVRNPRAEGTVAGTPGTNPTNWVSQAQTGVTRTIVGTGTENGIPYIDLRYTATSAAAGTSLLWFEGTTAIAAVLGEIFTGSFFARLIAGDMTNVSSYGFRTQEYDNAGTAITGATTGFFSSLPATPLGTNRQSFMRTIVSASAAFVRFAWQCVPVTGTACDFTIRIGAPQIEKGYGASSLILPPVASPAASTRAADREWVTGLNLGAGITLHAEYTGFGNVTTGNIDPISLVPASTAVGDALLIRQNRTNSTVQMALLDSVHGNAAVAPTVTLADGTACSVTGAVQSTRMDFTANALALQSPVQACTYAGNFTILGCGGPAWGATPGVAIGIARWRRLCVYAKALTPGQVVALSGSLTTVDPAAAIYDSGVVPAGLVLDYGQTVKALAAPITAQYARCDISDPTNPDGFINIPLAFGGPVYQGLSTFSFATLVGRDSSVAEVITRGGQEYPMVNFSSQRRWELALLGIRDTELAAIQAADIISRTGANLLFIPDPTQAEINQRAVFGRVKASGDFAFPYGTTSRVSWRARITERL